MPLEEELDKVRTRMEKTFKTQIIEKGFTQAELAKMLHVSRPSMSLAISGATNPQSVEIRKQLYKILDLS